MVASLRAHDFGIHGGDGDFLGPPRRRAGHGGENENGRGTGERRRAAGRARGGGAGWAYQVDRRGAAGSSRKSAHDAVNAHKPGRCADGSCSARSADLGTVWRLGASQDVLGRWVGPATSSWFR